MGPIRRRPHNHHQQHNNVAIQHPLPLQDGFNQPDIIVEGLPDMLPAEDMVDIGLEGNGGIGNGNGNGNGDEGAFEENVNLMQPGVIVNHFQQQVAGNEQILIEGNAEEGITFEQARARLPEIQLLPENSRIELYKLTNDMQLPEIMFDDQTDNTRMWTEELIEGNGDLITHGRPHLKTAINSIRTRMQNRRAKVRNQDNIAEEQLEQMTEADLGHRHLKMFCVFCWQRYQVNTRHSSKLCRDGRALRRLATFSHHNNGEQMPLEEQQAAVMD